MSVAARGLAAPLACALAMAASAAQAQDMEPRSYSNAPVGMNFLVAGYAYTRGGLSFDSLPLTDAKLTASSAVLAYARVLDLWGMSAKFDATVPYASLSGTADYQGQPVERKISGFIDPAARLSINFYGAPALTLKEFAGWEQDLVIGASLRVSAPASQYDHSRIVNIGTNRWSFKPEIGASQAFGPWTLDIAGAVTMYTDNRDFYGGNVRSQDPLYSVQGHVIYGFRSGSWVAFDATYFTGGRSTLNGVLNNDLQANWRAGATFALPVDRLNSVKFFASSGVSARTGNNFDLIGAAWQHRWGGGL